MLNTRLLPLRNDRAQLRAMIGDDAAAYAAGTADPLVRRYAHLPEPAYTEASVAALIDGEIRHGLERGDLAVLTIVDPETDRFAGSLVLFDIVDEEAEVGFWLHPHGRGKGLAADALELAAELARRSGLLRLTARTLPENEASQRVLERCGYIRGDRTRTVTPSGAEALAVHYSRDLG
ncbi:acetyltransferase [Rhodococcus pyridinivorans SB3094]|uniref:Acetyltransferase n=1 Tax=Rhodococcus pyridinivorans SB3094 TaxID=1435356 RepID=V9XFQ8_9NOCA|nr:MULTISPECIES: GNAT family protein [Rhodococcus]AHD20157.1 acetyltransferase [Rhodococcus pyridinivorans SB3094]MCT7292116.1 GNAT family N-acetyltransferase [Rhodococcus sp. PAE-6]